MKVKLLSHTMNPELLVATAAKLCYSSSSGDELMDKQTDEGVEKFIKMLKEIGHESPFEHASFTFSIEGVSRITEVQLVRHRLASYSIKSGRYVKINDFKYVTPANIAKIPHLAEKYQEKMKYDIRLYTEIVDGIIENEILDKHEHWYREIYNKINKSEKKEFILDFQCKYPEQYKKIEKKAIEDARYALPQALCTNIIVTMNVRSLINFFEHRLCNRAQWEIREMAREMLKEVRKVAPVIFKKVGPPCSTSNICPEGKMQCEEMKDVVPTREDVVLRWKE